MEIVKFTDIDFDCPSCGNRCDKVEVVIHMPKWVANNVSFLETHDDGWIYPEHERDCWEVGFASGQQEENLQFICPHCAAIFPPTDYGELINWLEGGLVEDVIPANPADSFSYMKQDDIDPEGVSDASN